MQAPIGCNGIAQRPMPAPFKGTQRRYNASASPREMPCGDAQSALLGIAAMYDRMARRAAEREAKRKRA